MIAHKRLIWSLLTTVLTVAANVNFAEAAPRRADWCNGLFSADNAVTTTNRITWINPNDGATSSTVGPTTQITMPPSFPGTGSVAAIGIHAASGTLYAFDRTGTKGTLYKYKFGTNTTWQSVTTINGLVGLSGTPSSAGASNNLNKMTVDGNTLYIAESAGLVVYSIPLNSSGDTTGDAIPTTYSFSGDPIGTPSHTAASFYHNLGPSDTRTTDPIGSKIMNGGDITTDEYGDVYNITYNVVLDSWTLTGSTWIAGTSTTKAYFYKQVGTTWVYQGETAASAAFAGAAFYKGELYVKSATQLKKVPLVRSGNGYTGWSSTLTNVGSTTTGFSSADLAACGTPAISFTKTQQIFTNEAATTLSSNQTTVKTGEYIKYTITAKNTGTAWAFSSNITDTLPAGVSYVTNSAELNGTNLGLASYPSGGFPINAVGVATGLMKYTPDPDTATLSFVVQVTATSGTVQNQATIAYVDGSGLTSETPDCASAAKLNCAESPSLPLVIDTSFGTCPAKAYVTQGPPGPNVKLFSTDLLTGTLTQISTNSFMISGGVNAIGFSQADNYIYGMMSGFSDNIVARIDVSGVATSLGQIAGVPFFGPYISGDVNSSGVLHIMSAAGNKIYAIDVNPSSSTYLTLLQTITLNIPIGGLQDFAFHPSNGKLYTVQGSSGTLYEISWSTGSNVIASDVNRGQPSGLPGGAGNDYGAMYFDSAGDMYIYKNAGAIYKINNVAAGSATARILTSSATAISNSDGARCALAPPIDIKVSISGTVWNDSNGSITIDGAPLELGTNAGGLTVYAVDSSGNVIDKATVAADGTYTLSSVPQSSSLTLRLSTNSSIAVGSTAPSTSSLPTGWTNTGENLNGTSETSTPGEIALTTATTNPSGMNFGIEQLPNTDNQTFIAQTNPGGTSSVQVPAITFTDPEDNNNVSSNASSFVISSLPTNATVYYNNAVVTEGQTISGYNPTLLTVDPADGDQTVTFNVAAFDAAGKLDPVAATVSMEFTAPALVGVGGTVWNDANGGVTIDGTPLETGTNATGLTVYALDSNGNVMGKAIVATDGTYTLAGLPQNTSLTLRLSSDLSVAVGATAPLTSSLPTGWINTGENLNGTTETATPGDIALNTGSTDLSGFNFGIEQTPTANAVNASSQANPGGSVQVTVPNLSGTDPEDGTLATGSTIIISSLPTNAALYYDGTLVTAGQVIATYDVSKLKLDPDDGAISVGFDYKVRDAAGQDSAPASITMPFTNLPPVAADVTNSSIPSTAGPTTLATGLNATDPDGTVVSYTITSLPDPLQGKLFMADGITEVAPNQVLTPLEAAGLKFDPSGTYNGDSSFKYTATDNNAATDSSDATYTIPVTNNPPVATDVTIPSIPSTAGPTAITSLTASDTDGTISSYTILSLPPISQGVLYMSDGTTPVLKDQVLTPLEAAGLKFDPSGTYTGDVVFNFTATDNNTAIAPSPASFTVPIGNNPPTADDINNPAISIAAGPTTISSLSGADTDGTLVSYTILSLPDPLQGTLYLADGVTPVLKDQVLTPLEASTLKFDPSGSFSGTSSFTYTSTDNLGLVDASAATFNVPIQNLPPEASDVLNPVIPSTAGPTSISSLNASDVDGTVVSYTVLSLPDPTHGKLFMADGITPVAPGQVLTALEASTLKFDPLGSFTGNASFSYTGTDNNAAIDASAATFTIPVGNNPPVAEDLNASGIASSAAATSIPSLNATDTDGTIATYTILSLPDPLHGKLLLADGTTAVALGQILTPLEAAGLKFDPSGTYTGPASFTYSATDNNGANDPSAATVNIPIGNTPPSATDTTTSSIVSTAGPTAITSLTASDPDGTISTYTVSSLPDPLQGKLYLSDGVTPVALGQILTPLEASSLKFDPSGTSTGDVNFSFSATDNDAGIDPSPATYTIPVGNNPPTAIDTSNPSIPSSAGPTAIAALQGSDTDGTVVSYTVSSLPDPLHGKLYLSDGITPVLLGQVLTPAEAATLKFDPSGTFNGTAGFNFTVTDNNAATDPSVATYTIPVGNTPPVANDVSTASIPSSDGPTAIDPLIASDPDGTVSSFTILSLPDPLQGKLLMADGITPVALGQVITPLEAASLKFDPSGSFNGDSSFTYTATDNNGAPDPSPATYTIPVGNTPPVASDVLNPSIPSASGPTAISSLAATDVDGTVVSYTITSLPDPTQGKLYLSDGVTPVALNQVLMPAESSGLKFDPSGSFTGTSSFKYTASDNNGTIDSSPAVFSIPIGNNPPTAFDVTNANISVGAGPTTLSTGLSASDTDGTIATYTVSSLPDPLQGKLYLSDGVTPVALGQVLTPLEASTLKFDPSGDFAGASSFTYTTTDNLGLIDATPATYSIPLTNLAPQATDVTSPSIPSAANATSIPSLAATDTDGTIATYTISNLPDPLHGTLLMVDGVTPVLLGQVLTPLEASTLKFDPSGSFTGSAVFAFTTTDNLGLVDASPANYTIPVGNNPPTALDINNPILSVAAGPTTISSLNATDTDGTVSGHTILSLPDPLHGKLLMADGVTPVLLNQVLTPLEASSLKFDPSGSFVGDASFTYTATDDNNLTDVTAANFIIPIQNAAPSATDTTNASIPSSAGPTTVGSGLNATDADGTVVSYTILMLPPATQGKLLMSDGLTPVLPGQALSVLEAAGLKFDPSGSYTGDVTFTFTATDNNGALDPSAATYTIPLGNTPPVANDLSNASIPSTSGPTTISSLIASDPDGTVVSYTVSSLPDPSQGKLFMANGVTPVTLNQVLTPAEAATLKFDPSGSFTGTSSFTYTASDNNGGVDTTPATVTIPVGNNPPTAVDVTAPSIPGTNGPTAIPSLNASDTDGTIATYTISSLPDPSQGKLFMADGVTLVTLNQVLTPPEALNLKFDPSGSFNGTSSFTFTATDNNGLLDPSPATYSIPVGNTPPVASDVTAASIPSSAGATSIPSLVATDSDGTIQTFTISSLPNPLHGKLLLANGITPVAIGQVLTPSEAATLKFDPSGTFNGPVSFTFTATDNSTATDPTPAIYTIPLGNTPPVADDVTSATLPSTAGPTAISSLVANDPDGTIISYTVTVLPDPSQGVLLMPDGVTPVLKGQVLTPLEASTLQFDPNPSFSGPASFKFTATDNNTAIDPSDATVTIPVGNNPPSAVDVNNPSIPSTNGPTTISSLNASDTDGTVVSYTITSLPDPTQGTLYLADGITPVLQDQPLTLLEVAGLKFDPSGLFVGDASFKYTATDNKGATDTSPATVVIPLQPGIKISGTVWNDGDGNAAQNGGEPGTNTGALNAVLTDQSGKVLQVVPVANDGTYSFNGITPNTDLKVLISSSNPSINSNFVTPVLPSAWTNTTPSSLAFNSGISDVNGKNFGLDQTPVATGSSVAPQSNPPGTTSVAIPSTAFTGSDPDGKVTTYTITNFPTNAESISINGTTYTASSFPSAGVTVPANPDGTLPSGAISVDPKEGAITVTIPFTVTDNAGKTSAASSVAVPFNTVSISGKLWDDADANQTQIASEPGTNANGLNAVLTDSSGKVLTVVPVNPDGTYNFSSAPSNTDLKVLVSSENPAVGSTYTTPVTPTNWTNTTPSSLAFNSGNTAVTDKNFGLEQLPDTDAKTSSGLSNPGGTNTVAVPALSGSDPEDGVLGTGKTFVIVTPPTNGTLIYDGAPVLPNATIINYDPSKLVFDPNDDILTSSFTVAAVDAAGRSDATPATITLNFKPVAKPDSSSTPAETPVKIPVLTNDSSTLSTITGTTPPANGMVVINPDGTLQYTPKPGFSGTDSFTYTACDSGTPAQCSTSTVTVQVTPTATPDTANTPKNNPVTIPVLANDKGKLDPSSLTIITPPAHGTLLISLDGTIKYTPALDYEGPDSFTYQICDLNTPAQCTSAKVDLNVSPNLPPVAQDKLEPKINSDVTLPLAPLAATDTDGTISSHTITTLPASNQGVLYLGDPANGGTPVLVNQVLTPVQASSLFFKPNPNFGGEASFGFTATDNFGAKDATPATVRIPVNAVPQSTNDTTGTPLNTPVIIPILENDKDLDGTLDSNTVDFDPSTPAIDRILILPNKGTFTATADGKVTFVPDPSFSGSVTVPYSVNDDTGARSNTSSITVNVQAGQIFGHVYSDLNGNGVQDAGEPDLVGVNVKITPEGKPAFTVTTDANGNYGANVPPGNVTADVTNPGNTRLTTGNDPQTVGVNAGSSTTATPVGFQPLEGNLTGRVFNDANANGVQDDGELGLENVALKITDAQGKVFEISTDANGDYRVANAAAGNATIEVIDPNGQVLTTNNNPQSVNVKAGSSTNAGAVGYVTPSIGIQKRALTTEVSIGSSLEYEIVVTNTSPVVLRDINVVDELPVGLAYKTGSSKFGTAALEPAISIKDGRQVLTWILNAELAPAAQTTLRFTTTVTPNAGTKLENVAFANGISGSTSSPVSTGKVKSAVAATVVKIATFTDKTALVGRVYFDKDQDRNFDPSKDEPLAGARLYLSDGRYAITDSQGRYNFAELEPGEHVVRLDPLTAPYRAESIPEDRGLRGTRMIVARGGLQTADFPLIAPDGDVLKVRSTTVKRGPVTLEKGLVEAGAGYVVSIKLQITAPVQDLRLIDPLPSNATRGPIEFRTAQLVQNGQITVLKPDSDGHILIPGVLEAGTYELRYAIFSDLPADLVITDPSIRYTEVIR
jgi:uncharacterized repeat protein (TIGR01451 family)